MIIYIIIHMKSKNVVFLAMFLIVIATLGVASANEDIGNQTLELENDDLAVGQEVTKTFDDVQTQISQIQENGTVELEGTYLGSGTPIKINKSLTIQSKGNGATLDGRNLSSILNITADNVVIKNIKFINAFDQYIGYDASPGGAINWMGNNGKVINSSFLNAHSYNSGGAINWKGSNFTVEGSDFKNCYVSSVSYVVYGGSLYLEGDNVAVDRCRFSENTDENYDSVDGSAIYSRASHLKISNSNFSDLTIANSLIFLLNSTEIQNCSFIGISSRKNNGNSKSVMCAYGVRHLDVLECNFTDIKMLKGNGALTGVGSAMYARNCDLINIDGCYFSNHTIKEGCIYLEGSNNTSIRSSGFFNSRVASDMICMWDCNNTLIADNIFDNITSQDNPHISIQRCPYTFIVNNTFNGLGDSKKAIHSAFDKNNGSKIINCTFSRDSGCIGVGSEVEIIRKYCELIVENVTCEYGQNRTVTVTFRDANSYLNNRYISIMKEGQTNFNTILTDENGQATFRLFTNDLYGFKWLDVGEHNVFVRVGVNDNYQECSNTFKITVQPATISLNITNKDEYYVASRADFDVEILDGIKALSSSDRFSFYVNDEYVGSAYLNGNRITLYANYEFKKVGNNTVKVVFKGNANAQPANVTKVINVLRIPTAITSLSSSPVSFGDESLFEVGITPYSGKITDGKLVFYVDNVEIGRIDATQRNYRFVVAHAGLHNLTAEFTQSVNFTDSIRTIEFSVLRGDCEVTADNASFNKDDLKIIKVYLKNSKGKAIANSSVVIYLNDGKSYSGQTDAEGIALINVTDLKSGNYTFHAEFKDSTDYNDALSDTKSIIVKIPTEISIETSGVVLCGEKSVFNVKVTPEKSVIADGIVMLCINGIEKLSSENYSLSTFEYVLEKTGTYNVTAVFNQSMYFEASNKTIQVTVNRMPTNLTANDFVFNQYDEKALFAALTDIHGAAVSKEIRFRINNSQGQEVSIDDLKCGEYTFVAIFDGDEDYFASQSDVKTIIVRYATTIKIAEILNPLTLNPIKFSANLSDDTGMLDSSQLRYFVDGVEVIGDFTPLKIGIHNLRVVYDGDKYHSQSDASLSFDVGDGRTSSIIQANDITVVYGNVNFLKAVLKTSNGKLLENANVEITLNGQTKVLKTDKNGEVSFEIVQAPKTYSASIVFKGDTYYKGTSKNVNVVVEKMTPILIAGKKTFKAKTKTKKYTITLKTPLNAKVTLKIGKKTFKATTNAKGKATFKIKKLSKKGKYKAIVKFAGDSFCNPVSKTAIINIKK